MKATIVPNLLDVIDDFFNGEEGHRNNPEFLALCERIAGKEVDLVFVGDTAFEAIDDNYWLPNCCWTPVVDNRHYLFHEKGLSKNYHPRNEWYVSIENHPSCKEMVKVRYKSGIRITLPAHDVDWGSVKKWKYKDLWNKNNGTKPDISSNAIVECRRLTDSHGFITQAANVNWSTVCKWRFANPS